jgi:hypothetical protein
MPVTHLLYLSALLFVVLGVAHSYLGERYILTRLFRVPGLPSLSGSVRYMQRILRLAWHVTSVAWFGLAGIIVLIAQQQLTARGVSTVIGITSLASFVVVLVGSRGKHVAAWLMFLIAGTVTVCYGAGI